MVRFHFLFIYEFCFPDTAPSPKVSSAEEVSFVSSVNAEEPSTAEPTQTAPKTEKDFEYVEPEYWIGIDFFRAQAFLIIGTFIDFCCFSLLFIL